MDWTLWPFLLARLLQARRDSIGQRDEVPHQPDPPAAGDGRGSFRLRRYAPHQAKFVCRLSETRVLIATASAADFALLGDALSDDGTMDGA